MLGVGAIAGVAVQRLADLGKSLFQGEARLTALIPWCQAISSKWLSTGWVMTLSCGRTK